MDLLSTRVLWVSTDAHLGPRLLIAPPAEAPLSRWARLRLRVRITYWITHRWVKGLIRFHA